jgi:hypothetical protein
MDVDSYRDAMAAIAADDGRVYDAIAADLYAIARVLQRKYLWLRRSYLALLATLGASGLVALATMLPHGGCLPWLSPWCSAADVLTSPERLTA